MNITVPIPDDLGRRLAATGDDIARRALEAFAVEEFRVGNLSQAELRRVLGFATRGALDAFLKTRHVYTDIDMGDLDRERRDLDNLGLR
ncbi:MAG: UPF0175 family protein [Janthinobacterium lividum]